MAVIRTHYLDASVIVKLLIREDGSDTVRAYLAPHATQATTSLCFAETLGVLKTKYKHKLISAERYFAACEELMAYLRCKTLEIEDLDFTQRDIFDEIEKIASKYSLDMSDAYQLVTLRKGMLSQLEGDSRPILVTADEALASAVKSEGLRAWDCMHEPAP